MAGPLIVTAELGPQDFACLDAQRRRHYPPDRNQVPAHLTIFRALPPSAEDEVRRQLSRLAAGPPPQAAVAGMMDLGSGVAYRIASDDLDTLRNELSDRLHGLLSAQDGPGWRPHITIQNKVAAKEARALLRQLEAGFRPRRLAIHALGLHRYLGGPWEKVAVYPFRGRVR